MTTRYKGLTIALLAVLLLALAGVGHWSEASAQSTLDKVRASGKLRVNVLVGEEPGFIKDPRTGQWSGYFWDMALDIANELGLELVPVETTWGNVALDLQSGKIDMAIGVNPTGARALVVDYTYHPVFINSFVVVARDGLEFETWSELDQPGVRVGVDIGSSHDTIATRFLKDAEIVRYRTRDEVILALGSGKIDALVNTTFNSLIMLQRNPALGRVVVPTPVAYAPVAIAVPREAGGNAWREVLSVVVWGTRASGRNRELILENLAPYGVTEADLPDNVEI